MGWKASIIVATAGKYLPLSTEHDTERAEQIAPLLGISGHISGSLQDFDRAIFPDAESTYIGAYKDRLIVCDWHLPYCLFGNESRERLKEKSKLDWQGLREKFLSFYPQGEVLALGLHSVVDYWAYSLYSKGESVREVAGSTDNGVMFDIGSPIPEELEVRRGKSTEECNREGGGEEIVFKVSGRCLGPRVDLYPYAYPSRLQLSEFRKSPEGIFSLFRGLLKRRRR